MTRKEIEQRWTLKEGIIQDQGAFENESVYVPYFVDLLMNGDLGNGSIADVYSYEITPEDVEIFPELDGFSSISIWVSSQGFWYHSLEK